MPITHFLYLLPLIFLAYFFKATTGFGSMIIMLAVGSIVVGPMPALLLTASLDVIGGLALLKLDTTKDSRRVWQPMSLAMLVGVIIGALTLRWLALPILKYILGFTLLAVGLWLICFRHRRVQQELAVNTMPATYGAKDLAVCLLAGTSGGLTGISAPPVIYYFGSRFGKEAFRRIVTRIFLVESITRVATYIAIGVMSSQILLLGLIALPVMYLGLYVGNRAFFTIPEAWFGRVAGVVAVASAVKLVLT